MSARRAPAQPRTIAEIRELAGLATCGQCWAGHLVPCTVPPGAGPGSHHLARYRRATRRGLISDAELAAVQASAGCPPNAAAVVDLASSGGA